MPLKKYSVTLPTIYDKFACKCDTCRNTCCQKWTIYITRGEYNKLRHRCKSEKMENFFQRLPRKQATDANYATVRFTPEGYCPYLTEDYMCGLQQTYGYSILPWICKQFPRTPTLFSDDSFRYSLDTGCERVNELLWEEADTGLHFITEMREVVNHFAGLKSGALAEWESDIQNLCIWLMQNRSYSLSDRLILLGFAMRELDEIQKENAPERIPAWFVKWQAQTKGNELSELLAESPGEPYWFVSNVLKTCYSLYLSNSQSFSEDYQILKNQLSLTDKLNPDTQISELYWDQEQYLMLKERFYQKFPNVDDFFENYIVLNLIRMGFPFELNSCWDTYTLLVTYYSLTLFLLIVNDLQSNEAFIDKVTFLSRETLNLSTFSNLFLDQLKKTNSDSLAHLAILVRG